MWSWWQLQLWGSSTSYLDNIFTMSDPVGLWPQTSSGTWRATAKSKEEGRDVDNMDDVEIPSLLSALIWLAGLDLGWRDRDRLLPGLVGKGGIEPGTKYSLTVSLFLFFFLFFFFFTSFTHSLTLALTHPPHPHPHISHPLLSFSPRLISFFLSLSHSLSRCLDSVVVCTSLTMWVMLVSPTCASTSTAAWTSRQWPNMSSPTTGTGPSPSSPCGWRK